MGLHELPLVGGLCHIQRTLTIMGLKKSAPHRRTLASQQTWTMLGHHELPLVGGLCHIWWTSTTKGLNDLPLIGELCLVKWTLTIRGHTNNVEHTTTNQWRLGSIANDARSKYPKTSLQSRIILICSGKQMIQFTWRFWRFLGWCFSLLTMRWCWVCFLRMLNWKKMSMQKSKDLWWKIHDEDLCVWISVSHAMGCSSPSSKKEELRFEFNRWQSQNL